MTFKKKIGKVLFNLIQNLEKHSALRLLSFTDGDFRNKKLIARKLNIAVHMCVMHAI